MSRTGWSGRSGRLRVLRWALSLVSLAGVIAMVAHGQWTGQDLVSIAVLTYAAMGFWLTGRVPENPVGWIFLGAVALAALDSLGGQLVALGSSAAGPAPWYSLLGGWLQTWFWWPLFLLMTTFTVLLFPDGLPGPRWRWLLWSLVTFTCLITLAAMFRPAISLGDADGAPRVDNPVGLPRPLPAWMSAVAVVVGTGLGVACLTALVSRFRRSQGVERQQLRWFTFAACVLGGWIGVVVLQPLVPTVLPLSDLAVYLGLTIALALIPVSCALAILRYRLYDIDRIISRTTSYAIVTALVLGTYGIVVSVVLRLLPDASNVAVAAATLTAAAIARPAVRRVQRVVDRHFDRIRYDQVRAIDGFGGEVRHLVDPDEVRHQLLLTVQTCLQPSASAVWSRGSR